MSSALPSVWCLLLSLLIYSSATNVDGGGKHRATLVASVSSLFPADSCSTPKGSSRRSSLKIAHRYGPCSPLGSSNRKRSTSLRKLLLQDQTRVASLQQRLLNEYSTVDDVQLQASSQAGAATIPLRRGASFSTGNYVVTVGIGTPKRDQTVIIDTGSSVCWIQCRPCARSCYAQQEPVFDPSTSSSYRKVSCEAAACSHLHARGCSAGACLYGVRYGDNSTTIGFLSQDALTLTATDVFGDFVFGCGQNNQGLFGKTAGLVGLSRDALSLASQASERSGGVFSYCLPASSSSTGHLTFGPGPQGISYTNMLSDSRAPDLYFLELTGISVGGQQLSISPTVFSTAGTLIDSGTVITRLPPSAYDALRSAFRSGMASYKLGEPLSLLDTCYDLTGKDEITIPAVALHFSGGVVVRLDIAGTLFVVSVSQVCLGFAGNKAATNIGIIGNIQQRGLEVVYDLGSARIGFGTGSCG